MAIWRDSLSDFRMIHRKVLIFESLFILLSGFVFVPFFSWLFDRILRAGGRGYLVNSEVITYAFDLRGALAFLLLGSLMVFLLFTEIGVILILAQKTYFSHKVSIMDALATVIRRLPRLIGLGMIQFLLLMVLVSPLIDSPMLNYLLSGYNIDILILNPIRQSILRTVLSIALGLIVFLFVCRLIFSIQLIIIRHRSMTKAMKESWQMTKGRIFRISASLVAFNLLLFGLAYGLLVLVNYLPVWLNLADRIMFIQTLTIVFTGYIWFILTMIVIPLNIIVINRLYYDFQQEPKDQLVLSGSWIAGKAEKRIAETVGKHSKTYRLVLFALLALTFVLNTQIYSNIVHARWNVMIAAHRGDPIQAPENTLAAIEAAISQSVDFVEIDVQISADNVPVLFHDNTLRRIDGTDRSVKSMTLNEIKQIDAGSWFSDEFAGEKIPTLEDVIQHVDDRSRLLIDVKLTGEPELTARILADLIEQYDIADTCLVQSFSPRLLSELRSLNPEIKIGQILTASAGRLERMDVDFYTISQNMLTENFVKLAREQKRQVWVWTVNSERNIKTVLQYDINGIITDYPQRVRQIGGLSTLLSGDDPVSQLNSDTESSTSESTQVSTDN